MTGAEMLGRMAMVRVPKPKTLARYGLRLPEWDGMLRAQEWRCPICDRQLEKTAIDHEHVKGWKKMPPEKRRRYVRGVVCMHCNHRRLGRFVTVETSRRVVAYLEAYEGRR